MKPVFDYDSYRDLLRDYYDSRNSVLSYSYRDFSREAGVNSTSWLLHLIRGTKSLSKDSTERVIGVLDLKGDEAGFFRVLVAFTQAKTSAAKDTCYARMLELRRMHHTGSIGDAQYEYFHTWYHPVIRSLVSKVKFDYTCYHLARAVNPPITPKQARQSVKLLKRLGFIEQAPDGSWRQKDPVVTTSDEVSSLGVINYHKQVAELARDAHDRCRREMREISAVTLGIGEKEFQLIKQKIQAFRREVMEIARNAGTADRVYQLNFQLFPVSKLPEDGQE